MTRVLHTGSKSILSRQNPIESLFPHNVISDITTCHKLEICCSETNFIPRISNRDARKHDHPNCVLLIPIRFSRTLENKQGCSIKVMIEIRSFFKESLIIFCTMSFDFPRRAPHLCIDQEDIDSREYDTISFIPALTLSTLCKNHF